MLIIDCHCHYGAGDGLTGPWDTRASLRDFLQWSRAAGIHRINLFAAFHSDYSIANAEVAALIQKHPRYFYGFVFVHPERDRGRIFRMVKKGIQDYGFCGIKVHRYDARITREICETARTFRVPVLYDVVGEVPVVELLAREYPDVNFIIPHLGSFADDWRAQLNLIPLLERHPNIYADTSGTRRFDLLQMAVRRAGPSKFLFGSDGPWLHPKVELEKVKVLPVSSNDKKLILSGNFLRLVSGVNRNPKYSANESSFFKASSLNRTESEFTDPWLMEAVFSQ